MKKPRKCQKKKPHWKTREPNRPQAHKRGYNHKWRKARKVFLENNPLCVFHQKEGYVVEANTVDHIIPHKGDEVLFWDENNWQALCHSCHSRHKQREEKSGRRVEQIGEDGWPM